MLHSILSKPFDVVLPDGACPTKEELALRKTTAQPYVDYTLGMLKSSIKNCEKITLSESHMPSKEVFSAVISAIGKLFADTEEIEVSYEKPEDKNRDSPTFGCVFPKIVIKNLSLINAKEELKETNIALVADNQRLKKSIRALVEKKN